MQLTVTKYMDTKTLNIFEPAMCCSTGVCGPDVDTQLVQFVSDIEWVKTQGVVVNRYNLSQNPDAFIRDETVNKLLSEKGEDSLPIVMLDGQVAIQSRYPKRSELTNLLNLNTTETASTSESSCCGGSSCCS